MTEYPDIWVWPRCPTGKTYLKRYSYIDTDFNVFVEYRRTRLPFRRVKGKWCAGYRVFIKVH